MFLGTYHLTRYHLGRRVYLTMNSPRPSPCFDLSDLSGDTSPVPLETFLAENEECPPDPDEVRALRACAVGETARLGIGGGFVSVRRMS